MSADNAFDVWIVDRNTVYQRVPYNVVADWVEEGRLLDKDCVRPAGQTATAWQRIKEHAQLAPFLASLEAPPPGEEPTEVEQEIDLVIEARRKDMEDDDVDMIPLIDISMVLLVFFIMTAENLVAGLPVNSPEAYHAILSDNVSSIPISCIFNESNQLEFIVGEKGEVGERTAKTEEGAVTKLINEINQDKSAQYYKVIIRADRHVPYERVQLLTEKIETTIGNRVLKIQAQVKHRGGGD
jgi:biopolymer transport protein ExbD